MFEENTDFREYIDEKKESYNFLLSFLENNEDIDIDFNYFIKRIENENHEINREELEHFLQLIISISNNYYRGANLIKKIEKIIQILKDKILQTFSNMEIFNIFKSNKLILLLLIENQIIIFNDDICTEIMYQNVLNRKYYCLYFYPELKSYVGEEKVNNIKKDLLDIDQDIFTNFDEKRHTGENDSYICSLIRQDSVEEFIAYVNRNTYKLSSIIQNSIFETNGFLIDKQSSLIEYAAFFGSIQIFQYLRFNNVQLKPSLWLYVMHSKNAEIIHLLEESNVSINELYESCLIESIKCHHNDIANYIENTKNSDLNENLSDAVVSAIFCNHNYSFFTHEKIDKNLSFFYLCLNNYNIPVNLYIKAKENELNEIISEIQIQKKAAKKNQIEIIYYLLSKQKVIGADFFNENNKLEYIAIPPSITTIEKKAFSDCVNLKKVSIPPSVTFIGDSAFDTCSSLIEIIIPPSITSIRKKTFSFCTTLRSVIIPSSVTTIEKKAFAECPYLTHILIPPFVTTIGENAFNCSSSKYISNLKEISIPSSVTSIGKGAFMCHKKLMKVFNFSSITKIEENLFKECSSLVEITIPSSVTVIENGAFEDCTSLEEISIPSSVTYIGKFAFCSCKALKNIILPSSLTIIEESAFSDCSSLIEINIPSSVKSIGFNAFYDCNSLKRIYAPYSISKKLIENIPKRTKIIKT